MTRRMTESDLQKLVDLANKYTGASDAPDGTAGKHYIDHAYGQMAVWQYTGNSHEERQKRGIYFSEFVIGRERIGVVCSEMRTYLMGLRMGLDIAEACRARDEDREPNMNWLPSFE